MSPRLGTGPFPKESGNYPPSPAGGNQRKTPGRSSLDLKQGPQSLPPIRMVPRPLPADFSEVLLESLRLGVEEAKLSLLFLALPGVRMPFVYTYLLFQPLGLVSVFRTFFQRLCLHEIIPSHRCLLTLHFFLELITRPFLSGLS